MTDERVGRQPACRATAPVRLDFAGGWTDVAPFCEREQGMVVNGAVELRAEAEFRPGGEGFLLSSIDQGVTVHARGPEGLQPDGRLDLLKAALRRSRLPSGQLITRCSAPAGSGLGSSGALDVALVGALDAARGLTRSGSLLAEEAFALESIDAALPGGRQDQYAAALGGFHRFRFGGGGVEAEPLRLDPAFAEALAAHIVIGYTGISRVSSRTIERVMGAYARGEASVVGALRAMVTVAERMTEALGAADLDHVARLLLENWQLQQQLDPAMRTEEMAALESAIYQAGGLGGKAAGAGAGGAMFFIVSDPVRAALAVREAGARLIPFTWAEQGLRVETPT